MASFQGRVIGAMTLNVATYEEVEADQSALGQAAAVVVLAAVSSGIGWIWYNGLTGLLTGTITSLIAWAIGATVVWAIGTKLMPGPNTKADIPEVMRVVGFAQAPGLLSFITIIPILGWFIMIALAIWGLVAWVLGVKQALDYDDWLKPVIVCGLAWLAMIIVAFMGAAIFGIGAMTMNSVS